MNNDFYSSMSVRDAFYHAHAMVNTEKVRFSVTYNSATKFYIVRPTYMIEHNLPLNETQIKIFYPKSENRYD